MPASPPVSDVIAPPADLAASVSDKAVVAAQTTSRPPTIKDVSLARAELGRLWQRGTEFLGCPVAIMGGAMSWVSEKNLVAAISNAGGFGVIACGAMTPEMLAEQIAGAHALTDKPFGVNLITMHPQLDDLIRVTLEGR